MPPSAADFVTEATQSPQVRRNCMVVEVAIQDPLEPRANLGHGFVPPLVEPFPDRGRRRSHALLGRQSHALELPLLVGPTTMCEPEEVERFRPTLPPLAPSLARI